MRICEYHFGLTLSPRATQPPSVTYHSSLPSPLPYPPDSQAAAEKERLRKKAEEDQAKKQVCLETYPDMPQPLHYDQA